MWTVAIVFVLASLLTSTQIAAAPITYEVVPGTDFTGSFTVDFAQLSLIDYAFASPTQPGAVFTPSPGIESVSLSPPGSLGLVTFAFAGDPVVCIDANNVLTGNCWRLIFLADVTSLTYSSIVIIEPLSGFDAIAPGLITNIESVGTLTAVPESLSTIEGLLVGLGLVGVLSHRLQHHLRRAPLLRGSVVHRR